MVELRCVINDPKTGKSYQKVFPENIFTGKHLGEKVPGGLVDLPGYELQITGGSDTAGFPHLARLDGVGRRKPLIGQGQVGAHIRRHGMLVRKTVRGKILSDATAQVNLNVVTYGTKGLPELLGVQEKPAEEKKEKATPQPASKKE